MKYLSQRHETHLIAQKLPAQTEADVRRLEEMGIPTVIVDVNPWRSRLHCALGLPIGRSLRVSWTRSHRTRIAIEKKMAEGGFDLVHIDRMRIGQYAPFIPLPKVVDFTDSLIMYFERSIKYRRKWGEWLVDRWELATIPSFERWLLPRIDAALVCSGVDAAEFEKWHPGHRFDVIANAVDAEQFKPKNHGDNHRPRAVITGTLFYFPNIDSVLYYRESILPRLKQSRPGLETLIIGTRPEPEITVLDGREGMRILANVPRMEEHLYEDDIYLCPLRAAAGVRNKLLEAMAASMTVVTTPLGAEGMNVRHEKEVLMAETPDEFAHQFERAANSPELRRALGANARRYVIENHSLPALGAQLERLYERLLQK
ncbi:MAG: glycosyltransferase family 4 protein [Candidatus Omnitrophota bacterium]